MPLLLLQNGQSDGFGHYLDVLEEEGADFRVLHPYRGEPFPAVNEFDGLLIGGAPFSTDKLSSEAFLRAEHQLVVEVLQRGTPCFGICFGGQLLAQCLGAKVRRNPVTEIGTYSVQLTAVGASDRMLRGLPLSFPVFQWHRYTFDVPSGAELLATGSECRNQMFRMDNVVGVQFHAEVREKDVRLWCREGCDDLRTAGKSAKEVCRESATAQSSFRRLAVALIRNFLCLVGGQAAR